MNEQERPAYYAIIPSNVRYCEELKFAERLLYGEITALAGKFALNLSNLIKYVNYFTKKQ